MIRIRVKIRIMIRVRKKMKMRLMTRIVGVMENCLAKNGPSNVQSFNLMFSHFCFPEGQSATPKNQPRLTLYLLGSIKLLEGQVRIYSNTDKVKRS